nr:membrane-bound lytic murein transglycosylase MltF [Aestuariibacter salexigens]
MISVGALVACTTPSQQNHLQRIIDTGVLKVGTQFGRSTYYNGATGPEGFEYELAAGFADYLGVRLEVFAYYNLGELFPQVQNGHIDLVAAGISMTPERQQQYRFGPAYQDVSQKLVFKQGADRPRRVEDLTGELIVVAESSHAETLRSHQSELSSLNWRETENMDPEELLELVATGELDYTIADSNILAVMRRRYPDLSIGFTIAPEQGVAWMLSDDHNDALLAALVEYFGIIQNNGQLAALEDKYFGHIRQFNYVDTREFIKAAKTVLPEYKALFQAYAQDLDWRLIAAMSYQESHWDPRAKSPTGVRGMMMLTLATAKDWDVTSRLDAEQSIRGGAEYFASLLRRIPDRIEAPDRIWLAMAAYNIGLGHLEDARVLTQRYGGNPDMWIDVKQHLPLLRQKKHYRTTRYGYARGDEAVTYVDNIRRYYDTLVWLDENPEQLEQPASIEATD